ncbi:hypothetical protein SAMN05660284_00398 [Formivibrio citricus]|uniref:Uncharacterized protein n=1 Tax=Formivibrio citricus TaxID=83765 RepID=A0A1I4VV34_9NEIS|nr:hypothetical protein [Formivibrio citricus]SFN05040.1 hypothetical protein SAMN05660284_00398 [Formivibrio citricus]
MFSLTREMALQIQELHIRYYADRYPGGEPALRAALAPMTYADQLRPGVRYAYKHVNAHIPRAQAIDALICGAAK